MWRQSHWVSVRWRREQGEAAAAPAVERAARPEQVTRTALLVFSPPAAQAKTLSTPRVRALARAPIRPPRTNNSILRTESGTPCRRLSIGRRSARWDGQALGQVVVFRHACKLGFEGIVSKRLGSPYRSGRSRDWIKSKNPAAPAVKRETEEDWGRGK